MVKLPRLAVYALMTPAITLGIGSALAADSPAELAGAKEQQRTTQEQRNIREQRRIPGQAQGATGNVSVERAQKPENADGIYLSSAPANAFSADELMGSELKSRADDESIGAISDLVIDEHGQITAVVVEAGEFLGLGKKNIAISWDAVERTSSEGNDGYDLSVDTSKDELKDAPEYKAEAKRY